MKNIAGTIIFDDSFQQMIRIANDAEDVFPDPVIQVNHQKYQFSRFLRKRKIPYIPIETLVVMTNTQALMKITSKNNLYKSMVIRSTNLINSVNAFKKQTKKRNPQ